MDGSMVRDRAGRLWVWRSDETHLGELGSWVSTTVGVGGSIGGKVAGGLIGGAAGGPIGIAIGLVTGIISAILGAHAAKVQREDKVSGSWASSGPQAISATMDAWKAGQLTGSDAVSQLQSIEQQFLQMSQPITKYQGKFGSYPDPNAPRPSKDCNWACGTSWDLHQQIQGLTGQIQANDPMAAVGGMDPATLGLIAIGALALLM